MDDRWTNYLVALAKPDQPRATFAAIEAITKAVVGTKLFTAMTHDTTAKRSLRVYSGNEQAYPTGGWKPLRPGPWTERVIERQQPFSALTIEEIAVVFPDWELIRSLGCESSMNLPIIAGGRVIGTINLLAEKGYYTAERVAASRELLPFAAIAFLLVQRGAPAG